MPNPQIRVAYICHYSNNEINSSLPLRLSLLDRVMSRLRHKSLSTEVEDFARWNSNAITEMRKYKGIIDFHVITPYRYLSKRIYEYEDKGIYFHVIKDDSVLETIIHNKIIRDGTPRYAAIRKRISHVIRRIKPDIIHMMGAENPIYSSCIFDVSQKFPIIVQLQTLLSDSEFEQNYNIDHALFLYRQGIEREVICHASYIATRVKRYKDIIINSIKSDAQFLDITLPVSESVDISVGDKKFDFVYFAANIDKAADYAIESFIIASEEHPGITLDIIGGYDISYRQQLEQRLNEHNLLRYVFFEGKLLSHEEVICRIRLSRFALLPLKVDLVSGTIREAMANGLPVITTVTPSTPRINEKRKCVLLSQKGDFVGMAKNMCLLLEDDSLAETLRQNGGVYMKERLSNETVIQEWVLAYKSIIDERR